MNLTRLRAFLAVALVAGFLSACGELASFLNIFLVRFFYGGGGVGSLILPTDIRSAATTYAACDAGNITGCTSGALALGLSSGTATKLLSGDFSGLMANYTDKSKYGMNLGLNLGADNSGNADSAAFPVSAALNLFVQEKIEANKLTTKLPAFGVAAGKVDTIPVTLPVTLASLPSASFKAMLEGDSIPYFLNGRLGFDLKTPTGQVLSSHETDMDIATSKIATRPNDDQVGAFLDVVSSYVQ